MNNEEWKIIKAKGMIALAEEYKKLTAQAKILDDAIKEAKEAILSRVTDPKTKIGSVLVQQFERKGDVDMKAIVEEYDIDVEAYRKEPTKYWRIS